MRIKRQCDLVLATPQSGLVSPSITPSFCYPADLCIAHLLSTLVFCHLQELCSLHRFKNSHECDTDKTLFSLAVSLKAVKVLVICIIYDAQLLVTFVIFVARKP